MKTSWTILYFIKKRFREIFSIISKEEIEKIKFWISASHFLHACIGVYYLGCKNIFGSDLNFFNSKVLKRAKKFNINLLDCNLGDGKINYADNFFELILLSETLEHLDLHPKKVFEEIYRF